MDNWMQKFEKNEDEQIENELNSNLENLLVLLDNTYKDIDKLKVLEKIIKIYENLKNNLFHYDEKDYIKKKKEIDEIKYKIMEKENAESLDSNSWNEYKKEEQIEEDEER